MRPNLGMKLNKKPNTILNRMVFLQKEFWTSRTFCAKMRLFTTKPHSIMTETENIDIAALERFLSGEQTIKDRRNLRRFIKKNVFIVDGLKFYVGEKYQVTFTTGVNKENNYIGEAVLTGIEKLGFRRPHFEMSVWDKEKEDWEEGCLFPCSDVSFITRKK